MPGMATPEELARLQQASPEEADELFLRLMIPHHQAAAEMAEAVLELTDQPEVVRFAQRTAMEQQAEIRGMQALLQRKGLPPEEAGPSMPTEKDHAEESPTEEDPIEKDPGEGFAAAVLTVAHDTARLAPLPLAVLAAAWLGFDAVRRRTRTGDASPPVLWRVLAVSGLSLSAALNIGLASAHFEETNVYGYLFSGAGIALATAAAAIWARPSRLTYLAGAALPLALISLWTVFQLAPPSGAGSVEPLDLMELFTVVTELLAMVACAALWLQAPRGHRRKRAGVEDGPVNPGSGVADRRER